MPEQTVSPLHAMVLGLVMIDAERARRSEDERDLRKDFEELPDEIEDEFLGQYIDRRQAEGTIYEY